MSSNPTAKKYHKSEILALCQDCPDIHKKGCIIADIEGSRDEYLPLPKCMKNRDTYEEPGHPRIKTGTPTDKNRDIIIKNSKKTDSDRMCPISSIPMKKSGTPCSEKTGTPQYIQTPAGKFKLKEIDMDILRLLAEKYHQRKVAKELNKPLSTINRRITRLEKAGLITAHQGVYGTKIYTLSNRCPDFQDKNPIPFIYNEDPPADTLFTAHSMSFKFPILEGDPPKSSQMYKTASWDGSVFKFSDHTIRCTTKSVLLDINQDLGAGSIDNLVLQYSQLAQSHAYKFAEKHHIVLGGISKNKEGHFTIEDNALAQIVTERGEFQTTSGTMFNKSQSRGDMESNEPTARAFEFTINKLPAMTADMQSDIKNIASTVDTKLAYLEGSLDDIQKWLFLERENKHLREQNQVLEKSLINITTEVKEIRTMLPKMYDNNEGGMYG